MCIEQLAMSCCDIDDLAAVISCMAIVLFSPSGIFIIMPSAFAKLASEQPIIFDFADAGTAAIVTTATTAAQANLEIICVPRNESRHYCRPKNAHAELEFPFSSFFLIPPAIWSRPGQAPQPCESHCAAPGRFRELRRVQIWDRHTVENPNMWVMYKAATRTTSAPMTRKMVKSAPTARGKCTRPKRRTAG